ncbi:fumarylacetoacetate hydrolase family protein [Fodinicurvata sediminis]|uniref:fumarylacetoacetate hydrolase family protein n=1 Tax=Fodinicurvata sediminis TaxID=1121832 RepID=UPI0004014C6B|nr:fumarylacetoacetate hydrolase family protein [Fodinicurvata sediminis]
MKIAAYHLDGKPGLGIVSADGSSLAPFDLNGNAAEKGVLALVDPEAGRPTATSEKLPLSAVKLRAPVPHPRRNIFCVGKNYYEHAHEFAGSGFDSGAASGAVPDAPIIFSKVPECVSAAGDPIPVDSRVSSAIDYEAELAVIIGRGGRGISKDKAMEHVWGYTIVNDITARDLQGRHKQWLIGKSQDGFCPMGPVAVTADELDLSKSWVRCHVNGELRQEAPISALIFDIPTLIETLSAGITLYPGDVIATGTPAGVGIGFQPPRYLRPGDRVAVDIDGIGRLENPVSSYHEAMRGAVA